MKAVAVEMHYTLQEIALLCRKCEKFIRVEIKSGRLHPAFMVGGSYVCPASAVNAYLAEREVPTFGVAARNQGEARRKLAEALTV
jgi:hypothetical protein